MRSQWPVSTQMQTMDTASEKLKSSADVKRPHKPNDIRLPSEHGRIMYWHIGNKRNANATVAITVDGRRARFRLDWNRNILWLGGSVYLLAVQTANNICIESKKKNITSNEMDAPSGRHRACIVSSVANLFCSCGTGSPVNRLFILSLCRFFSPSRCSVSIFRLRNEP